LIDTIQVLMAMTKVAEPVDSQGISVPQAQKIWLGYCWMSSAHARF
jgi:hypothetical protein